jgi:hypothetical protein
MKKRLNVLLSIIASLYFITASIFHPNYTLEILGVFTIVGLILNLLIFEESIRYDGQIVVSTSETNEKSFILQLEATPEELAERDIVSFKIVNYPKS